VVQDYKTAFYWLEKAARLGQAQAQATLGEMYHSGIAINGDIQRAYLWFNLAAAQGVESAVSSRDLVVKLLTPNQIAALQEEAIRISRGYRSLFVADESKAAVIKESDPVYEDSASADEPMPLVEESSVKAVILKLKDWWEKPL
jgi:TPR repeat protein